MRAGPRGRGNTTGAGPKAEAYGNDEAVKVRHASRLNRVGPEQILPVVVHRDLGQVGVGEGADS